MKAVLVILGLVIATSSTALAGNGENLVDHIMKRKVTYPEALREKGIEAKVKVQIRVLNENSLEIVAISSENLEMTAAVKQQIERMKVNIPKTLIGQTYNYVFKFEVQQ